jgi:PAS domain S-box-containing protein
VLQRIRSFFTPPIFTDPEKAQRAQLVTYIAWSAVAVMALILVVREATGVGITDPASLVLEGLAIAIVALVFFVRRGRVEMASELLVFISWGAMAYEAWIASGIRDAAIVAELVIILVSSLLLGWKTGAALTLLDVVLIWSLAILETRGILRPVSDSSYGFARDLTGTFALAAILMYIVQRNIQQSIRSIRSSQDRFRKFFHSSVVAICIADLEDGRFIEANEAFWKLSGLDPERSLGKSAVELGMWEGGRTEREEFVRELKEKQSLQNVEYDFSSPAGKIRNALAYYELIELNGRVCVLAMFYDVTEKKMAEQALRETESRTRALLNAIPDMIFELDRDGTFLSFIKSQEADLVVPPADFVGRKVEDLFPVTISSPTLFGIERALATGLPFVFEYRLASRGEPKDYEARIVASGPDRVLTMIRDITARKLAEAEREQLIQELENKNAELERFTYTVSHDLKAPLITIKGFVGFMQQDAISGNAERLNKDIQRVSDAANKMQQLLNELLELSRIGRLMNAPERVPFETLLGEALELTHGSLSASGARVRVEEGLPAVFGDRRRLVEMLQNLLDNAAKFMGAQPDPLIEVGLRGHDYDKPVFFIRDNGMGIAPQYHERIFGLFNKLDPKSQGTGVGLALVRRIIEVHGGRIWVESEEGKGATFCFTLQGGPPAADSA